MNYEGLIKQAEIYFNAHEDYQAIECATQAIDLDNSKVDGYYWRGVVYRRIGEKENMKKDADALLNCTPITALHFAYRGWAYNVKGNCEKEAIIECTKAITQDVSEKKAYFYRAWAYGEDGDFDLAIEDYGKAIELDPKFTAAYNNRGFVYNNKGDYDRAIKDYDKAIELDPRYYFACNNRLDAYHAKDENLAMKLVDIRKNETYMADLRDNIKRVVPFIGAGASKPYGYYTWGELLQKLFDMCCRIQELLPEKKEKIQKCIDVEDYMGATSEMDEIFANISSAVCILIERAAEANPITAINMRSILSEYLHLFPNKKYLTTNYDRVMQDILEQQGIKTKPFYPTSALKPPKNRKKREFDGYYFSLFEVEETPEIPKIYYLHGVYDEPASITLSKTHYDDYYGADGDFKINMRKFLPTEIFNIYHNSIFLYIGCGMTVKQDRILKILREFYGRLKTSPSSYALLNVNEIAKTKEAYENWGAQSEEMQKKLNTALDEKEEELADMNVRVIWYSAPKNSVDGHESAKRQLFKYILGEARDIVEKEKIEKQRSEVRKAQQEAATKKQEIDRLQAQFDNMSSEEGKDNSKITTPKEDVKEIILTKEQLKQVEEFFKDKFIIKEDSPTKQKIAFPIYNDKNEIYQMYLVSEKGNFYLSDNGTTYAELDKIFELKEPDVIKNLVAILKKYKCSKQQGTNAFIIDCTLQDINIKMSYLIQAISFMLNMKIFYV